MTDLRERVIGSVRKLRSLELDMLQVEIIDRLMDGKRTPTELVIEIYGIERGQKEYQARYIAIRRELKNLESKGYVSTNILGRDRPYRLTRHGIAVLSSILPETHKPRIIKRPEIILLTATIFTGICLLLLEEAGEQIVYTAFAVFFFLTGVSAATFLRVIRRVY